MLRGNFASIVLLALLTVYFLLQLKYNVLNCRMFERGESDLAISQCRQLLHNAPDLEVAVRRGDVYCLLVAHAAKQRDWKSAASLIEELKREAGDNLAYYLPAGELSRIILYEKYPLTYLFN